MSDELWWYATRAAGLMTWSTACASTVVGLALLTRFVRHRVGGWLTDLHRFLSVASIMFLLAHGAALTLDSVIALGWREILIPGESTWEPEAATWGIIAAWTLIAVQLVSLVRNHISAMLWRTAHGLAVLSVAAGAYHAWLGGSDVTDPTILVVTGLGSVIVVTLVAVRLRRKDDSPNEHVLNEREAVLEEMRERLENLPVPQPVSIPQMTTDSTSTLPRRAPAASTNTSTALDEEPATVGTVTADTAFADDPFSGVPPGDASSGLTDWLNPPGVDPFGREKIDPFRNNAPPPMAEGFGPGLVQEEEPDTEPVAFGGEGEPPPFLPSGGPSPFGNEPPPPAASPTPTQPPPENLFAPATAEDEPVLKDELQHLPVLQPGSNPFRPVNPPPSTISVPTEPLTPATVSAPTGPPPLPDAVDPATGKPDEAAYAAWLVEWLAYAERYGEETPEDPSRA